jgi:CheY-like chemotaxis protein
MNIEPKEYCKRSSLVLEQSFQLALPSPVPVLQNKERFGKTFDRLFSSGGTNLPRKNAVGSAGENSNNRESQQKEPRLNVIIVDDDREISFLYSIVLRAAGFNVVSVAANGREAIERVEKFTKENKGKLDVVIIDQKMPEMSGVEATQILKENYPGLPVVMISAYDIPNQSRSLFEETLVKPVSKNDLVSAVRRATKSS